MSTFEKIYDVVKSIPKGRVMTYGQVAILAGNPRWARVVGYALHSNPNPNEIPCHRVVMKDGSVAPGFVFGGPDVQKQILSSEGITFTKDGKVDMEKHAVFR
ncbi:MAG: MGMT family protein [Clostridia bacterium]|nr:MGMT family protein [Clostridia bacterium]